jgi:multiple sugar transport system permease protein
MYPTRGRSSAAPAGRPSTSTDPPAIRWTPTTDRMKVDFPLPLGPSRPVTVPFATWLLMGFFKTIPSDIEDAAQIDGASRFGTLVRVVFPISVPGILTVVIFSFSLVVNEFVYAFTFISSSTHRTVSTGVYTDLIRGDLPQWGAIMVAALIPSIPLALLYNTFLDRFIAGFTGGAFR